MVKPWRTGWVTRANTSVRHICHEDDSKTRLVSYAVGFRSFLTADGAHGGAVG
jgi:hypothetical protein